jgi:hypothetical protein
MATFHAEGKPDLTKLVGDEKFVKVTKRCLCRMFGFLLGLVHVSKYGNNNVVMSSIYQVPSFGP